MRRRIIADFNARVRERLAARAQEEKREGRRRLAALLRAALLEPRQVQITHLPVRIPKLPPEFHGFRIVQISDVHHSSFLGEAEIAAAARRANELRPDLTVLTGDYVSHSVNYIPGCARALGHLKAPLGVYAVLGNHDHWTDGELMARTLTSEGIRVLSNENVSLRRGPAALRLAGVDDIMAGRDDLRSALAGTSRDEARILLSHNPAIIREAARAGVDLVLSGHTHGGQINWKLLTRRQDTAFARWLHRPSRRFMRGYAALGATQLYVNRGLGTVVVPLRYGCPPEITLIELQR
jgi:uncharacterized protein